GGLDRSGGRHRLDLRGKWLCNWGLSSRSLGRWRRQAATNLECARRRDFAPRRWWRALRGNDGGQSDSRARPAEWAPTGDKPCTACRWQHRLYPLGEPYSGQWSPVLHRRGSRDSSVWSLIKRGARRRPASWAQWLLCQHVLQWVSRRVKVFIIGTPRH